MALRAYTGRVKCLRVLLVVLLSVAVPFTATAAAFVPMAACSTSHANQADAVPAASALDCCAHTHAGSHHASSESPPCKASADCTSCATISIALSPIEVPVYPAPHQIVLSLSTVAAPHHDPSGLWRPPRSA